MASKKQTGEHPKSRQGWIPPRGIRYSFKTNRPKPFLLHWRDENGKRKSEAYEAEDTRETAARSLAKKVQKEGTSVLTFDPSRWRRYLEFQEIVGSLIDPLLVAREWREMKQGGIIVPSQFTVSDAVARYLAIRRAEEPNLSGDTWRHFDMHLTKRFVGQFGAMRLNEVSADMIRDWLAALKSERTGKLIEPVTKRHHRKDVNTFFERARKEGWIQRNPCELVAVPAVLRDDVSVISPRHAFEFFKANRDEPVIGRIALEAFGGIRYSQAAVLPKSALDFRERGIVLSAAHSKSRKRRYRQGHPEVLWAWLEHAPDTCWSMTLRQYREAKKDAFTRARIAFQRNVWRHSFASYLIALTKNLQTTGYLMQHTHTTTTEIYEGVASELDARLYLGINPRSVTLTWDGYRASFDSSAPWSMNPGAQKT